MPNIEIIQTDITTLKVDAIVNAANSSLLGGGGVDGAIHRVGGVEILDECKMIREKQGGCRTGHSVATGAGKLPAQYVIHTVGPIWQGGNNEEENLLAACYVNSLELAEKLKCSSIAFPNISTGVYHFPKKEAAKIALATVKKQLHHLSCVETIYFVCYDQENYLIYQDIMTYFSDL